MAGREKLSVLSLDDGEQTRLWQRLDIIRSEGNRVDWFETLRACKAEGIKISSRDLFWLNQGLGVRKGEFAAYPGLFADVFEGLIGELTVDSVLDCWAKPGGLLQPAIDMLQPDSFVGLQHSEVELQGIELQCPSGDSGEYLFYENRTVPPIEEDRLFDLVIGCPPMGTKKETAEVSGVEINAPLEQLLLFQCAKHLKESGTAVMLFSAGTLERVNNQSWWDHLELCGLRLNAAIHFPGQTFRPAFEVNSYLLVLSKGDPSETFIAAEADNRTLDQMLTAVTTLDGSANHPLIGVECSVSDFHGFKWLKAKHALQSRRTSSTLPNHPETTLGEICTSISRLTGIRGNRNQRSELNGEVIDALVREKVEDDSNIVFWGERKDSALNIGVATVNSTVVAEKSGLNWYAFALDPRLASARFMERYLNGQYGAIARDAVPISQIEAWPLWIPPVPEQIEIGRIDEQLAEQTSALSEANEELWNDLKPSAFGEKRPELLLADKNDVSEVRFEEWIDTLPFPLATALWGYRVERGDARNQRDQLDWFFETLNAFVGILFLSAVSADEDLRSSHWPDTREELKKIHQPLERPTRGTWSTIIEKTAKKMRTELGEPDPSWTELWKKRFACSDTELLKCFASKDLVNLLRKSNEYRNRTRGHGAPPSAAQLADQVNGYTALLTEFRNLFSDLWTSYPMVYAQKGRFEGGRNFTDVDLTMGSRTPFAKDEVETVNQLTFHSFNMIDQLDGTHLELLPFLQSAEAPLDQPSGIYFFGGYSNRAQHECRFMSCSHPGSAPSETNLQVPKLDETMRTLGE